MIGFNTNYIVVPSRINNRLFEAPASESFLIFDENNERKGVSIQIIDTGLLYLALGAAAVNPADLANTNIAFLLSCVDENNPSLPHEYPRNGILWKGAIYGWATGPDPVILAMEFE